MYSYEVLFRDRSVGSAKVRREGMFYVLHCEIERLFDEDHEIVLESKAGSSICGKCIPYGDRMVLTKRISVKLWDAETGKIVVRHAITNDLLSVVKDAPFPRLQDLPSAYYVASGRSIGFKDRSAPAPPGSDRNP